MTAKNAQSVEDFDSTREDSGLDESKFDDYYAP